MPRTQEGRLSLAAHRIEDANCSTAIINAVRAGGKSSSGPGRALDTNQVFVICTNVLGGCYGSTGPSSVDPATQGSCTCPLFPWSASTIWSGPSMPCSIISASRSSMRALVVHGIVSPPAGCSPIVSLSSVVPHAAARRVLTRKTAAPSIPQVPDLKTTHNARKTDALDALKSKATTAHKSTSKPPQDLATCKRNAAPSTRKTPPSVPFKTTSPTLTPPPARTTPRTPPTATSVTSPLKPRHQCQRQRHTPPHTLTSASQAHPATILTLCPAPTLRSTIPPPTLRPTPVKVTDPPPTIQA
jgi:hypothetical protein